MKNNFLRFIAFFCMIFLLITSSACNTNYSGSQPNSINDVSVTNTKRAGYSFEPIINSKMPVIRITTSGGDNTFATEYGLTEKLNDHIKYVNAYVSIDDGADSSYNLSNTPAQVKVRGNYTINYDKKPLKIKFFDKQSILGMSQGNKFQEWVLLAEWKDISMLNDPVAFYLGNKILGSDGYYCTDFRTVEVYLNDKYWGVYVLIEQQQVENGRIEVPKVRDDYKGVDIGYFFEYDYYYSYELAIPKNGGDPVFTLDYGTDEFFQKGYTIKSQINDDAQTEFIQTYMQNVFDIVYKATRESEFYKFNDDYRKLIKADSTNPKEIVENVIDIKSLVDTFILNEICCDTDINWSSFYMSVDMSESGNKKLVFQAPWDFDYAFGLNVQKYSPFEEDYAFNSGNPWFTLFKDQEWFMDLVRQKWEEIKLNNVKEKTLELISTHKQVYEGYYIRNYQRWPERIKNGMTEVNEIANGFKNQADAADYLYDWLAKRFDYLDSKWSNNRG